MVVRLEELRTHKMELLKLRNDQIRQRNSQMLNTAKTTFGTSTVPKLQSA